MKATGMPSAPFGMGTQQAQAPAPIDAAPDPSDPTPRLSASAVPPAAPAAKDLVMSEPEGSKLINMMGGVVRGAGPIAAGAAAGGAIGSIVPGVGTVAGAGAGAGAMGLAQIVGDPVVMGINKMFGTHYTLPTDAIEDLFTRIGVAEPKTEAEKLVQSISSGAANALSGVTLGEVLKTGSGLAPTTVKRIGEVLASGPLQQVMGGAGSSGAAEYARQQGEGPLGQFGAGLAGGAALSTLGNMFMLRPSPAHPMKAVIDASDNLNTQIHTSDVFPPKTPFGQFVQSLPEKIPFLGTGGIRADQRAARVKDVKNLLRQFGADDLAVSASDDVMADLIAKKDMSFDRWEALKTQALDAVTEAKPGVKVPMKKTIKSIDDSIAYLESLNNRSLDPAIQKLAEARTSFQNQTPANVLKNKQLLGDVFDAPEMTALKRASGGELKKAYTAVNDDLTAFIESAGGAQAKAKWGIANAQETKLFKELELDVLARTLDKGAQTPEAVKSMLFSKDKSTIEALSRNLTAKGRASARTAIMQEVGKRIGEDASPEKFLTEMRKLKNGGDPIGVFFSGDDIKAIEGLTRVLKATSRAGQAAVHPPTGVQLALPAGAAGLTAIFGGGLEGFLGSMAAVGGAGVAARIYESPTVRNLLMQLPKVAANSVEEAALFKRILEAAQGVQAAYTAKEAPATKQAPDLER